MTTSERTLEDDARRVLEAAWAEGRGYCVPNPRTYPHLWLWDSCFHSIAWAALGDDRAVEELAAVFVAQTADGFVPHMRYASARPTTCAAPAKTRRRSPSPRSTGSPWRSSSRGG